MKSDIGGWTTRLTKELINDYTRSGAWRGITLVDEARSRVAATPHRVAAIDGERTFTYSELMAEALRLCNAMRALGMQPGDVVSFQLPNWLEAMAINLAACLGGFVCNPIVPIYRDAEVDFILRDAKTKVLFVPQSFRNFDYVGMASRLRAARPELRAVISVRGASPGCLNYDELPIDGSQPCHPVATSEGNAVKLLLYTSGTTGKAKGVLHSHNTLASELAAIAAFWELDETDVIFMPSPVTHITGYLYALEATVFLGAQVVFTDKWDPDDAVRLITQHGATFCVGATPFLVELTAAARRQDVRLPSLRRFVTGGAPVPPESIRRANEQFENCRAFRVYGSSEVPTVSLGVRARAEIDLGAITDGQIAGNEVRIRDLASGVTLQAGQDGEISVRGPEVMLGYTDWQQTLDAFDAEGFFHTGDIGRVNEQGYLTITGRQKDMIIRGGENISPKEVEDVLHRHPDISEVAIVAIPNTRLGEGVCACIVPRPGAMINVETLAAFLEGQRVAKQKWPERVELMNEFPLTPAGKVRKNVLREQAAAKISRERAHTS